MRYGRICDKIKTRAYNTGEMCIRDRVQGDPGRLAALGQRGSHGDHPGVVALEDGLYVGSCHVSGLGIKGLSQIKGEILICLLYTSGA